MPQRVEILFIGDELLLGIRQNAHLTFLGTELARLGLDLRCSEEVRDHLEDIRSHVRHAWERTDLLITTGGLGPTEDDLTREALSAALGRPLVFSEKQEAELLAYFARRGYTPTENNRRQCYLLQGAEVLPNHHGTAPGQWLAVEGKVLVVLPGPARELRPMFLEQVVPRLRDLGWVVPRPAYLELRVAGLGESQIATDLEPLFRPHREHLQVAYCAHEGIVEVRLSSPQGELSESEIHALGESCRQTLGESFATYGEKSLAELVLDHMREAGLTLGVAESCTGGLLASQITDVPGASEVFKGGVVAYTNDIKENLLDIPSCLLEQHGAVSPETAVALATAAAELFETDYALSITGYAGPDGGREPPGTVYLGLHGPTGVWSRKLVSPGSRQVVKQRAVNAALDFLRRKLRKYSALPAGETASIE